MDRSTVTTLAKAMGGKIEYADKTMTIYQFPTEKATLDFRRKIPFVALWGGDGLPNVPPLNVYFDMVKDY